MRAYSDNSVSQRRDLILAKIVGLGGFELFAAAVFILLINPDPKNAILFGFSAQRLGVFLVALVLGCAMFALAVRIHRRGLPERLVAFFSAQAGLWFTVPALMCLAGLAALIAPAALLGSLSGYFERLRPLLVVIGLFPAQLCLPWLVKSLSRPGQKPLRPALVFLAILALLWSLIGITRLGVTYEKFFWNVAALPLTALQFIAILFTCLLALGLVAIASGRIHPDGRGVDIVLALALFLLAAVAWSQTPMLKHFFSLQPGAPYNQPYPFSDAQVHDIGALSITRGFGIYFGQYIDKPLYLVFLAFLHRLAGFDYSLLTSLHAILMALMVPALYWFGKSFHSRFFGLVLAMVTLLRQTNALLLSNEVASTNPRLLLTEVPTMLGLVLLAWLVFTWFARWRLQPWIALLAGGLLGVISLVRLNPVALLPAILLLGLLVLWDRKRAWLSQSLVFVLGFSILLAPWLQTSKDESGRPWALVKFQDVITIRYEPAPNQYGSLATATPAASPAPQDEDPQPAPVPAKVSAGGINVQEFPAFVINHALHNMVGAFLALPDSLSRSDQDLGKLIARPYWQETPPEPWQGAILPARVPFMLLNLALLALGLGWSWKRWRWAGMVPLLVFALYCLSLGFARNSGSRYLVPVDWIVFFYFCLGFAALAGFLLPGFNLLRQSAWPEKRIGKPSMPSPLFEKRMLWASLALVLAAASLVPLVQAPMLLAGHKCRAVSPIPAHGPAAAGGMEFRQGEILYPGYVDETNTYTFHACGWTAQVEFKGPLVKLQPAQPAAAGIADPARHLLGALYVLDANSTPQLLWSSR